MKKYKFDIIASSESISNRELIKLWSTFESVGQFGWLYQPYKDKQSIYLGIVSITVSNEITVHLKMKTKKLVSHVIFSKSSGLDLNESEIAYLSNVDRLRKKIELTTFLATSKMEIKSDFGISKMHSCRGEYFSISDDESNVYNNLEVLINAYGETHCKELALKNNFEIADIISSQCNSLAIVSDISIKRYESLEKINDGKHIEQRDIKWIDEYHKEDNKFIIPKYAIRMIDSILTEETEETSVSIRASHHFANSLKLVKNDIPIELIITQLMSAVEVIAETTVVNTKACTECGQKMYSIRKRVLALIEDVFHPGMRYIFDDYYINRSKYLHSGKLASKFTYSGRCLPKIASNSRTGCDKYLPNWDLNLIEWVGYIIRRHQIESHYS